MKNVHFAIPEIYGETLSYYELLRNLVNKTNELIDNYNTVPDQIAEEVANLDASQLFSEVLNQLIHSIATDNTKSANAVKVYKKHDLLYAAFNETVNLYESLIDFSNGTETELIVGTNIREVNISELFIELRKLIDINKNNIEAVTAVSNENRSEITTMRNDITNIENKNTEQDNEIGTLRTMISSPYNFKGEVASISALPASGEVNDTYYVQDVKYKVTWTGSAWVQSSLSEGDYQTELSELKDDLSWLTSEVGISYVDVVDSTKIFQNGNSSIVNNNDGTYTVGITDFGSTTFDGIKHITAGQYVLYGVPYGHSFISKPESTSEQIYTNESSNDIVIDIGIDRDIILGYQIRGAERPSSSFVITPYLRKIEKKQMDDIANLQDSVIVLSNEIAEVKGITIEGYRSAPSEWVDVKSDAAKTSGAFLSPSKTEVTSNEWNYYTIPVSEGEQYRIKTYTVSSGRAYYIFDNADSIIDVFPKEPVNIDGSGIIVDEIVSIPAGAAKLICNEHIYKQTLILYENVAADKKMAFVRDENAVQPGNVLWGKKLVFCGDSITAAVNPDGGYFRSYGDIVAERNGMTAVKDGIGGSTMANVSGRNPFCVSRYLNHTDFDYITLWFGWNDSAYSTVGTIDDTDDTTFYGAYKKVLAHYITTYPTRKIGVVVPYLSSNYENSEAIQQAVKEVAVMYGVPYMDLTDNSRWSLIRGTANSVQRARMNALTYDTTHPNQAGYDYISTMYEHFLRSL